MSHFHKNTTSAMSLMLSELGLFLATTILLTIVFSFVFSNDWQRRVDLQSVSSDFSNQLDDLAVLFFEHTIEYQFPQKQYPYQVMVSTEYLILLGSGSSEMNLLVTKRLITQPWVHHMNQTWTTGEDLHEYFNDTAGHPGTQDEPVSLENFTDFFKENLALQSSFAIHPFEIDTLKPVMLERVIIYYDTDKKQDILLIYQRP
jgi:hypothetical protein